MLSNGKTDNGILSSTGAIDFAYVKEKLEAGPDLSRIFLQCMLETLIYMATYFGDLEMHLDSAFYISAINVKRQHRVTLHAHMMLPCSRQ